MTQTQAAMQAYKSDTKAKAASKAQQVLKSTRVQGAMQEVLTESDIDDKYLSKILKRGLEARKSYTDKDTGELIESDIHDHTVQHKFLSSAIDLKRKISEDLQGKADNLIGEEQFEKDQGTKPQEERIASEAANSVSVVDFKKKYAKKPIDADYEDIKKDPSPSEEPQPSKKGKPARKKSRPS